MTRPAGLIRPFIIIATAALVLRFFLFIVGMSVNMPYSDIIPILFKFMHPRSVAELFFDQHTAHFQGAGQLLTASALAASRWDIRSLTAMSLTIQIWTALMFLAVSYRLRGWHALDALIPLAVLSPRYFELFTVIPNVSSHVFPLFLISVCALVLTVRSDWKTPLLAAIGSVTIFTGYGLLVGLPIAVILITDLLGSFQRPRAWISAVSAAWYAGAVYIFFGRYDWITRDSCVISPQTDYPGYYRFAATMTGSWLGASGGLSAALGTIFLAGLAFGLLVCTVRAFRGTHADAADRILFLCLGVTAVFIAAATVGRTCFGIGQATQLRYAIFGIPALVALVISWPRITSVTVRWSVGILLSIVLLSAEIVATGRADVAARDYSARANAWIGCYRTERDVSLCSRREQFVPISPGQNYLLTTLLDYGLRHRLMFFAHDAGGSGK